MAHEFPNHDAAFVRELKKFARRGYAFDKKHELRKGTDQDPTAKGTQREAFDAFTTGLEKGHRHGYFEIPTGVGKTALFISLIKNYLAAANGDENARVLIAVPSTDLVLQTAKAFAKFMPDLATTIETDDDQGKEIDWEKSDIGVQYGKMKHAHKKPKVLITTYQSLAKDSTRVLEAQVEELCHYIATLTKKQQKDICEVTERILKKELLKPDPDSELPSSKLEILLTPDNLLENHRKIAHAIAKHYASEKNCWTSFLDTFGEEYWLSPDGKKSYQSSGTESEVRVYPPEEYGFVVFDEGHNITANKFGRAVEQFQNSLELAVTATPEYSEAKTVAQKLPHCHFSLPLADAINRGDLCPVDPALIKTNYHVDEKKLRKFLEDQNGKNLTQDQMEKLLNEQSRNLAAIKTYLLASDPNTGERYLGRRVMAFAGGIQHCEDFTRQMNNVLTKPKYKQMRDWLKAEGIVLAACVHSQFPREGITLTIDGKKGIYTKEQVKELHKQGKILVLVSDSELKLGSDYPADSIVMELVDRLSVVDVTQRFGRGFRLDPEDPYKRCTAFNLVDENTYDIYKDTPHMLPIYAAEVLEGAEFRAPMQRKHFIKRFKSEIPNAPEMLQDAGFEVETNIDRVRAVSEGYKKRKKEIKPPADWLSTSQISRRHGGSEKYHLKNLLRLQQDLLEEWKDSRTNEESESLIKREWMNPYGKEGEAMLFVSPLAINTLIEEGKIAPIREEENPAKRGWWSISRIKNEHGGSDEKLAQILNEYLKYIECAY